MIRLMRCSWSTSRSTDRVFFGLLFLSACVCTCLPPVQAEPPAGGRQGATLYVSKLGDGSDGSSWSKAFTTIQAALDAIPDDHGGHRVLVRPDTYMEANLYPAHKGAAGSYNRLIGDYDGRLGSGTTGWVVIDSSDPRKGFKSFDWWSTMRATQRGWSNKHTAPTFSSIVWDRWLFQRLYATGADAALFWDCTNRVAPFTVVVEHCVGIGRAFGGGVGNCLSRPTEPIVFRCCWLWCLDWWGDAAGAYVRVENKTMPDQPDAIFEDCTLVGPDNALKSGNPGFHTYTRVKLKGCRLVSLNFSQPHGRPSTGIIHSTMAGKLFHVDLEDCTLMGYKVFGTGKGKGGVTGGRIGYTTRGSVQAYVQFQQSVPKGFHRLGHWPVGVFQTLLPPAPANPRAALQKEPGTLRDRCEVTPVTWRGRRCIMKCIRPPGGGPRQAHYLVFEDLDTGKERRNNKCRSYARQSVDGCRKPRSGDRSHQNDADSKTADGPKQRARFANGYSLACAYVHNDTLYVFASRFEAGRGPWNDVTLFKSSNLTHWESHVVIKQQPNEHLFNSSVCRGPDGFVMAYESSDSAYPPFTTKFARSDDLEHWTTIPDAIFGTDHYTACPCIRYADGYYYVLYTERRSPRHLFEVFITRSKDLKTWIRSAANPVLTPDLIDEGVNNSDPDLVEWDGKTYLYYGVGDQLTWTGVKRAVYAGSLGRFLRSWFVQPGIEDRGTATAAATKAKPAALRIRHRH